MDEKELMELTESNLSEIGVYGYVRPRKKKGEWRKGKKPNYDLDYGVPYIGVKWK